MEFSSLKFGVPSFFVLNKTERGATLSLILLEFIDPNLVLFSTLKQISKYELYPSKRLYFHFLYIDALLSFCRKAKNLIIISVYTGKSFKVTSYFKCVKQFFKI